MSSEIEVVEEVESRDQASSSASALALAADSGGGGVANGVGEDSLRNDVYTAAAYGDMEKLQRLVEEEGCSVSEPDSLGYFALQWAALNNRTAAAQYIIEVPHFSLSLSLSLSLSFLCLICFVSMGLSFVLLSCYLLCRSFGCLMNFLNWVRSVSMDLSWVLCVSMGLGFFLLSCCLLCMFFWMFDEFSELGSFCFTYYVSMQCFFC